MVTEFEQFSASVSSIYRCIQKIERMEMANFGLKGPHVQCLLAMNRYPEGITASQLCAVCDKDKAAISRTVAELEQEQLVVRCTREGNRYRAQLKLTQRGKTVAGYVLERVKLAMERAGEGLTEEQVAMVYKVLEQIARQLHGICADGLEIASEREG